MAHDKLRVVLHFLKSNRVRVGIGGTAGGVLEVVDRNAAAEFIDMSIVDAQQGAG